MKILEIREVIKYYCKKGMSPKEIHEDFMGTLRKDSPFYSIVKKWAAEFKRGERALRIMNMVRSCTPRLCVIGCETCEA